MGKVFFSGGYVGEQSRLPRGYTELAYIQSSGMQYIDTGFMPNQDTRVVLDINNTATATRWIFGARISSSSGCFDMAVMTSTKLRSDYGAESSSKTVATVLGRMTLDKNKNITDGAGITWEHTSATFETGYSLYLLTINTAGTAATNMFVGDLYSCQIYDNGTLVRDFVPCIDPDGNIGMYDLVNNQFYGNAGTGSFVGSEVA